MSYTPSYTRKNFVNGQAPSINANNLNAIEDTLVNLEQFAQSADEAITDNSEAILAEVTARTEAIEAEATAREEAITAEQTARENLEEATTEALTEVNKNLSVLANSNIQTSNDVLDWAMDGNIVSAKFEGYARKSRNLFNINNPAKLISTKIENDSIVNTVVDTRTSASLYIETRSGIEQSSTIIAILASGETTVGIKRVEFAKDDSVKALVIRHNGSVRDLFASFDISNWENGNYKLSLNLKGIKPDVVGGFEVSDIQIEKNAYTPYEPYGIIKTSGVVESFGKNLLDINNVTEYSYASKAFNVSLPSGIYTFSRKDADAIRLRVTYSDNTYVDVLSWVSTENVTFTATKNIKAIQINKNQVIVDLVAMKCQLEVGTMPTAYEPYKGSSSIELPYIPYGVNNIHDELIVNADGSGKYVKRVEVKKLNSIDWKMSSSTQGGFYAEYPIGNFLNYKMIKDVPSICSTYEYQGTINDYATSAVSDGKYAFAYISLSQHLNGIYLRDTKYSNVADLKASFQNAELMYELATPIETPLTSAEVAQILALKTFADTTYIDADGMAYTIGYAQNSAKAIKELQNIIKNLTSTQTMDDEDIDALKERLENEKRIKAAENDSTERNPEDEGVLHQIFANKADNAEVGNEEGVSKL